MLILATGSKARTRRQRRFRSQAQAGFSLVEILVVVFLMGLMSAVVVLSFPSRNVGPDDQAQQLAAKLRLASQDSITTGRTLGARVTDSDYGFYALRLGLWQAITNDRMMTAGYWDDGTVVTVDLGELATPAEQATIVFDPMGVVTRFTITLEYQGETSRIIGDGVRVRVEDGDA